MLCRLVAGLVERSPSLCGKAVGLRIKLYVLNKCASHCLDSCSIYDINSYCDLVLASIGNVCVKS